MSGPVAHDHGADMSTEAEGDEDTLGSTTSGIVSNPFLDTAFQRIAEPTPNPLAAGPA